jgi:hypothetical protein
MLDKMKNRDTVVDRRCVASLKRDPCQRQTSPPEADQSASYRADKSTAFRQGAAHIAWITS